MSYVFCDLVGKWRLKLVGNIRDTSGRQQVEKALSLDCTNLQTCMLDIRREQLYPVDRSGELLQNMEYTVPVIYIESF